MLALLDLPAPLFQAIDAGLATVAIPPLLRVAIYGVLSALATMYLYGRMSRQTALAEIRKELAAAHRALAQYDGEFSGLLPLIRHSFSLSLKQLGRTLVPALIAGLPLLFVLPWLSNHYGHVAPPPGTTINVCTEPPLENAPTQLAWVAVDLPTWQQDSACWALAWPEPAAIIELNHASGARLLTLPPTAPIPILHKRVWWNALIGNPAGYLAEAAPFFALKLSLPARELHRMGPTWLRGWEAVYFLALLLASLLLKFYWKLH